MTGLCCSVLPLNSPECSSSYGSPHLAFISFFGAEVAAKERSR